MSSGFGTGSGSAPPEDEAPGRPDLAWPSPRPDDSTARIKDRRPWKIIALILALLIIAGVVAVAKSNTSGSSASPSNASSPSVPTGLHASASDFRVTLTWSNPAVGSSISGYRIYRDGVLVKEIQGPIDRFVDDWALPKQHYDYAIESLSPTGDASPQTHVSVTTSAAPLSVARVSGRFHLDSHTVSKSAGVGSINEPLFAGIEFTPTCARGACSTEWQEFPPYPIDAKLTRVNATYQGTGRFAFHCGSAPYFENQFFQLHVAKASVVDEEWRATTLLGSVQITSPPQGGCGAIQAIASIRASLLPDAAGSVVAVLGQGCPGFVNQGSGFIAAKGYVITNAHVVAGQTSTALSVNDRGRILPATVVLFDPKRDIAVLRAKGLVGKVLVLNTSAGQPGESAEVVGYPENGDLSAIKAVIRRAVSLGKDIHAHIVPRRDYLLEARVRHGSSGSPLVSGDGSVIGVIWGGNAKNGGSAITSGEVQPLLDRAIGTTAPVATGSCLPESG
jgi:hypothetical protein